MDTNQRFIDCCFGKEIHKTLEDAVAAITASYKRDYLKVYHCPKCQYYHIAKASRDLAAKIMQEAYGEIKKRNNPQKTYDPKKSLKISLLKLAEHRL